MLLAEPRRRIAVLLQDFADSGVLRPDDGIVARIAGRQFADHTRADRMMVASRDKRGTRGRTERGGMELRVAQTRFGDAIHRGRRDDATERARNAVALVVRHDEQNVGRAFGRYDARWPIRRGVLDALLDHATEWHGWWRDLFAVNRDGGVGRTGCAVDLLGPSGRRNRHDGGSEHPAKKEMSC